MSLTLTQGIVTQVLEQEDYPKRFERFCVDLFSRLDGVDYVCTSSSWDLGRDGRGTAGPIPEGQPFICCSLDERIKAKAIADLKKLVQHVNPSAVRVCSSKKLSEKQIESIEVELQRVAPKAKVKTEGQTQIVTLASRYPDVFEKHYSGEISSIKKLLLSASSDSSSELSGLRVALVAQFQDNALELRSELTEVLILDALARSKTKALSNRVLSKAVSETLHLGQVIDQKYLEPAIERLESKHFVSRASGVVTLTELGREQYAARLGTAGLRLLEGRRDIHAELENLLGEPLEASTFDELWRLLESELSDLFMSNGAVVIEAISSISDLRTSLKDHEVVADKLRQISEQITRGQIGGALCDDVAQAVSDLFVQRESRAFKWLTFLCAVFVGLCSLGLEPSSQAQIEKTLSTTDLLLDTDIVISFLALGEPDYDSVNRIVKAWRSMGGRIVVTSSVVREVAYHAWISDAEFSSTASLPSDLDDASAHALIRNAFVRGFVRISRADRSRKRWNLYIREFRGRSGKDTSKIVGILKEEGLIVLESEEGDQLAEDVARRIMTLRKAARKPSIDSEKQLTDKSNRDGEMVAAAVAWVRASDDSDRCAAIVSSSTVLRRACDELADSLDHRAFVLPLSAVGYLLAFLPRAKISIAGIQQVLFGAGFQDRISDLEQKALRVIAASKEYSLGTSRRGTLKKLVRAGLKKAASLRGRPIDELEGRILSETEDGEQILTEVVAGAIDEIGTSRLYDENVRLKKENEALVRVMAENEGLRREVDRLKREDRRSSGRG